MATPIPFCGNCKFYNAINSLCVREHGAGNAPKTYPSSWCGSYLRSDGEETYLFENLFGEKFTHSKSPNMAYLGRVLMFDSSENYPHENNVYLEIDTGTCYEYEIYLIFQYIGCSGTNYFDEVIEKNLEGKKSIW